MEILRDPERTDIELPPLPRASPPIAWSLAFGAVRTVLL